MKNKIIYWLKKALTFLGILLILIILYKFAVNDEDNDKLIERLNNTEIKSNPEKVNPSAYMSINFNYHERFMASDYIEIKLQNNAANTIYKNINYQIQFLNNEGNVLTTENYSWNNNINPHQLLTIDVEHKYRGDRRFIKVAIISIEVQQ